MSLRAGADRGAILIVIDGCRADVLSHTAVPNMDILIGFGVSTFSARTVMPSTTLPVHFSIFTSLPPEHHGITENLRRPVPFPGTMTITEMVKAAGGTTCMFCNWEPLRDLAPAGALDHLHFAANLHSPCGDLDIAAAASAHITAFLPDFAFVYLGSTDVAGHDHGFMSREYLRAIQKADRALGLILNRLEGHGLSDRYNLILMSDHGGIDQSHHEPVPEVLTVPWIAYGPDIRHGIAIASPVSVLDTAPTLAKLLHLREHESWRGRIVEEILREGRHERTVTG
ncbi:MAG: alkaline phosphatase family protein [Syntrophobacteraceae bacterium]|jgi:arylsulfatase A-like enzyme|nr:alkaline phosphatase family protein [Syntrophobacteraceae bacterium]